MRSAVERPSEEAERLSAIFGEQPDGNTPGPSSRGDSVTYLLPCERSSLTSK